MRKIASLCTVLMLISALAFGQTRTVSGQVRDDKGEAVPFATIVETGQKNGTKADASGLFSIKIKDGSQLTISATGFTTVTMTPGVGVQNITLTAKAGELSEVVVTTALGVKKRPKEIGYANTTLKGDQLQVSKSTNVGQSLSGKVAGLTITNTSSSVNASPRITLRGNRSLLGNNQALIVLDGVAVPSNTISYLNPNDIESITVLKGGQAAALYGSDGVNGALVITTKRGTGKPKVSFSHTTNIEEVAYLPEFQTEYGSGSGYGVTQQENYRPFENQQYGDPYDGSIRSIGRRLADGSALKLPYAYIPNIRMKMWDKGMTNQEDISISGGDANSSFYLSFQDVNTKGIVPKDEYRRDAFRFNSSRTYGKFKISFDATYTVDRAQRTSSDYYFFALNAPSWAPMDKLSDWKNDPFANPNGYYNDYYNNPWFELDNNRSDGRNNYFNGNLNLNFKPLKWLELNYRLGTAFTASFSKSWTNRFDYTDYAKGLLAVKPVTDDPAYNDYSYVWRARNAPIVGGVNDASSFGNRINSDFIVTLSKEFGDFSGKLLLGNNIQSRRSKSMSYSSTSVIIPDLFNVSNRAGELTGGESNTEQTKVGNFGDLTLGYKDLVFLHGVFRYDQSSVFYQDGRPSNLYSYPYYGGDISVVLTDLLPGLKANTNIVNFLKLRGGWNRNGNDNLDPYSLTPTFSTGAGFPFGTTVGVTVDNTFPAVDLQPEFVYTTELGFEGSFWKNRINLDVSVYKQDANNQILPVSISSSTGYTTSLINAARVENKGIEIEARANIFKNRDWSIDINGNFTYNSNKVKELALGATRFQLNSTATSNFIFAEVGQPFPYLKTTHFQTDPGTGGTIIDAADGWPLLASDLKGQGVTIPKTTVGTGIRVSYKNFTLTANAEYRGGFVVYNDIGEDMAFTGSGQLTNMYHRRQFIYPNSVYFDGTKYVPNTTIPVENYLAIYQAWGDYSFSRGIVNNGEAFVVNGDFWKIRDMSLSYDFNQTILKSLRVVKAASISIFARNMFTFWQKIIFIRTLSFQTQPVMPLV
jgi:TonB-linked SusC/RagA family outer membrane protein